jgi:ADP-heptose:LPS heptosyltransferase
VNTRTDIENGATIENGSPVENDALRVAAQFLARFREDGVYLRESIKTLCHWAVSEDETTAKAATRAVFTSLVEPLADSFDPRAVSVYNRLFAQLIDCCRRIEAGRALAGELMNFKIFDEQDLFDRAQRLRSVKGFHSSTIRRQEMKRVIVLSRVTLGADVVVTSVIIERLKREFPKAEIVLVGGRKMAELFGGDPRLYFKEIDYLRAGTLIERLLSWIELAACTRELTCKLKPDEYLIVDPDSRLTQLGLLPLEGNYLFFPSREYGYDTQQSLGELTAAWLNEVFGAEEADLPRLNLKSSDRNAAEAMVKRMRKGGARAVVAINFGVGENPLKRIDDEFERLLVASLIEEGATIIFDKGAGEDETRRADAVASHAAQLNRETRPIRILEIDEASLPELLNSDALDAELLVWSGRVGLLAALIAESDLYIGYDSAGQHIAAAAGVPCIDVFAGFGSPRMLERWRPTGPAPSEVIAVDTMNEQANTRAILSDTLRHAREMLKAGAREAEEQGSRGAGEQKRRD